MAYFSTATPIITADMVGPLYKLSGENPENLNVGIRYGVATVDYTPTSDGEIEVHKNDRILIFETMSNNFIRVWTRFFYYNLL